MILLPETFFLVVLLDFPKEGNNFVSKIVGLEIPESALE